MATRFRLTERERCCAILESGRTCGRLAVRATYYFGHKELYGTFSEPWAGWVRVALCDRHSDDRQDRAEGE